MNLTAHHNLQPHELKAAVIALTKSASLEYDVLESLEKAVADGPRKADDPTVFHFVELFMEMYRQAQQDIDGYISRIFAGQLDGLVKAEPAETLTEGPLTDKQIRSIQQAIRDRFYYIAASMEGDFAPDELTLKRWKQLGIVASDVTVKSFVSVVPETSKLVRNAFIFGRLQLAIEKGGRNYADVLRHALDAPLLKPDQYAVAVAERQAATFIQSFGDRLAADVATKAIQTNRKVLHDMIVSFHRNELETVKLNDFAKDQVTTHWRTLASDIYHTMDDKARDWERVAYFETYDAKRNGEAMALLAKYGPSKMVYKMPMETACPQCKALYLDENGHPRLFKLSDMLSWGNNIGRKPMPIRGGKVVGTERPDGAETYQAVCGLVHNWCQCQGPFPFTGMEWWAD